MNILSTKIWATLAAVYGWDSGKKWTYFVCESVHHDQDPYSLFWQSREKIYGDTLPWSLWYRLRLQEPQESVPLYLVLLTHEARLHILSNVLSHARPVVPPLLQGLVVHIDDFVPNLIANAETSVQNVPWRVLLFQLWCNCALSVTTSYSTVGWSSLEGPSWANVQYIA